jgi:hypothetical protein
MWLAGWCHEAPRETSGAFTADPSFATLRGVLDAVRAWFAARTGGLYSVAVDDRGYAVARVVATGRDSVHVRVYSNRYRDRPLRIDRSELFLVANADMSDAALNATHPEDRSDPGAFASPHLPLRRASFLAWRPRLIRVEPLEPDDLAEYRTWRAAHHGAWSR